ncbi:MAG: helix-turn-helix domain-containing protein [Firmicutes bacterium]|nr:helix-turn-helix domain-containing protein [Bacillota bacterium]
MIFIEAYYSIGEISRLFGMSIQTLRYYDRLGLLRPAHVNKESNYRYYSHGQFLQIKLIKYLKTLGFSLAEIQSIVNQDLSPRAIIQLLREQEEAIDGKISELVSLRHDVGAFQERLSNLVKHAPEEAFLETKPERKVIAYDYIKRPDANLAVGIRKILVDIERDRSVLRYEPGVLVSYSQFASSGRVEFEKVIVELDDESGYARNSILRFPAGSYATLVYEGTIEEGANHYGKIVEFMSERKLQPRSELIHAVAASYVSGDGTGIALNEVSVRASSPNQQKPATLP